MTFVPAIVFNYNTSPTPAGSADPWIIRFPEFSNVSPALAQLYWNEAEALCRDTPVFPSAPTWMLGMLLNLLTAHIAWLNAPRDPQGNPSSGGANASEIVGQITSASEGSVSVGSQAYTNPTAAWFAQSRYGFQYWQMTASFRTMFYASHKRSVPLSIFPSGPGFGNRDGRLF